jgi:hypothetical protein
MSNTIKVSGEWWFPNSDIKFNGQLTFSSKKGGKLTIVGSLEPFIILDTTTTGAKRQDAGGILAETERICKIEETKKLILGKDANGRKVTLLYTLSPTKKNITRPNYSYAERYFEIDIVFLGFHFERIEDIKFENIFVEYSHLTEWLYNPELRGRTAIYPRSSEPGFVIEHFYGETGDIDIPETCSIQILSRPNIDILFGEKNKVTHHTYVKFSSPGRKTVEDYITLKNIFQDFLNFTISYKVSTLRILGSIKTRINEHHVIDQTEILYHSSISQSMDKIGVVSPYLLPYNQIKNKFNEIIRNWFELRKKMSAAYDLFFGVMYNTDLYLSNRFLMLAEALEIYIGIIVQENHDSELEAKRKRIDIICETIDKISSFDKAGKEWVKKCMKDKKSLSFKERMSKAFDLYYDLLPKLSYVIGTKDEFSSKVTELRHRLTHGNINYDELEIDELYWKEKDLQLIIQLCILSELKFSNDDIKSIYLIK